MNSQARFTQPFMFEVTYGIIIAFALLIEPLQFYIFKRLNKFIYSNFTFFFRLESYIFIYYNNFIFTIFSFSYFYVICYFLIIINNIYFSVPITESQIQAGYVIGSYKLKLLFLILSFLVFFMAKKYIERYYKPNVLEISAIILHDVNLQRLVQ